MTRIDFYVLQQTEFMAKLHFACKLAEKAAQRNLHTVIYLNGQEQAEQLSDYLWSFKPESFLPHQLQHEPQSAPITLLWSGDQDHYHECLINLNDDIPEWFSRFQRVTEIVVQEPQCLASTRSHYLFYRDRGYPLKSHQIQR